MKPSKLDIELTKGDTERRGFQWITKLNQTPMDLTDCVISLQVRAGKSSPDVLLELSTVNGLIEITDALQGKWMIEFQPPDTAAFTFNKAVYDMQVVFPSGDTYTVIEGLIIANAEVTRP